MSLQQVPGGPTLEEAQRFAGPVEGSGISFKYTTVNDPKKSKNNEYPIVPFAPDSYDTIASIKQNVGDDKNNAFGNKWNVMFTDEDAQYLLRQQAQVQNSNYERWLWQQYDVTNPAESWIFQQIAPEQFEKRKQLILFQQNLATRYAMLRLYGVKSEEDLMLKYLVETNQIELPKGPVWDPKRWMAAQSGMTEKEYATDRASASKAWATRYTAGMFSPLKYVNQNQVGYQPDPNNRADGLGWSEQKTGKQLFAGSEVWNQPYKQYGQDPTWAKNRELYMPDKYGMGQSAKKDKTKTDPTPVVASGGSSSA